MTTHIHTASLPAHMPQGAVTHKDATALLRADHEYISALFAEYESALSSAKKKVIVAQICSALTIHTQLEEEIFYCAVKAALRDRELVPEALVEHATLRNLIAQLQDAEPVGEMFEARVSVLAEYVKRHFKEEQNVMFPEARATQLDMMALGGKLLARKAELQTASPHSRSPA